MKIIVLMLLVLSSIALEASNGEKRDLDNFHGFTFEGRVINPACVRMLAPQSSDRPEYGAVPRSLIVDNCQRSNLAYRGRDYSVGDDGTVSYYEDPDDGHTYFAYKVIAKHADGSYLLYYAGHVGLFRLDQQNIVLDLSNMSSDSLNVLTRISETFVPCFHSAEVTGNTLTIIKSIWDISAPTAEQCKDEKETLIIDLSGL